MSVKSAKILITGSDGFVGSRLISLLRSLGSYDLHLVTRNQPLKNDELNLYNHFCDLENAQRLHEICFQIQPNFIVNTAAMTNVNTCEQDKGKCDAINVLAVEELTKICKELDAHLIHLSTDFIFDGSKGNYVESDVPVPVSAYGYSKWCGEMKVLEAGIRSTIVRTVLVYGVTQRRNFINWVITSLTEKKNISVTENHWRNPTYVGDLATGLYNIISKREYGIFHIAGKEFLSVYEFAIKIANNFELNSSLIHPIHSSKLNEIGLRPEKGGLNISKAVEVLDYSPISIDTALQAIRKDFASL